MDDDQRKHAIFMEVELRKVRNEVAVCAFFLMAITGLLVVLLWRQW
jgi:hypothetical protein